MAKGRGAKERQAKQEGPLPEEDAEAAQNDEDAVGAADAEDAPQNAKKRARAAAQHRPAYTDITPNNQLADASGGANW